jgi:hypothetical protein
MSRRRELFRAKVISDRPDHANGVEEGRRQGEVDRRATEHPRALTERSPDRVKGDRADNCY